MGAAKAKDIMQAWLSGTSGKDIEVVISNNDGMAMGAVEAMKAQGKVLPTFGVDALPEALQMIKADTLAGSVLNDGETQAKAVYALAVDLAAGKDPAASSAYKLDANRNIRVPYVGVDKNQSGSVSETIISDGLIGCPAGLNIIRPASLFIFFIFRQGFHIAPQPENGGCRITVRLSEKF